MTRKHNRSEKDIVITSTPAAAAARPRRAATPRAGNSATTPVTPSVSAVETETPNSSSTFTAEQELSREEVARLAYEFWLARGCQHGNPEEDWRRAEDEIRRRVTAASA